MLVCCLTASYTRNKTYTTQYLWWPRLKYRCYVEILCRLRILYTCTYMYNVVHYTLQVNRFSTNKWNTPTLQNMFVHLKLCAILSFKFSVCFSARQIGTQPTHTHAEQTWCRTFYTPKWYIIYVIRDCYGNVYICFDLWITEVIFFFV